MIRRRKQLARSTKPIAKSGKAIRKSPYLSPEWAALRRQAQKRSRGICEMQVACDGNPAEEVHHLVYAPGRGVRRLMVDLADLRHICARCHAQLHRKAA